MRGLTGRPAFVVALVSAVVLVGAGLVWFEPWTLWRDETVKESAPTAASTPPAASTPTAGSTPPAAAPAGSAPAPEPRRPATVAVGEFISHEHGTTGRVKILQLPDGSRTLRLEGLRTSNGPDLHVWITDAPVKEGKAGWGVFDDGAYESLGALKGNKGDQNYALPAHVDLSRFTSVSVWCDRFNVSFGAAELAPA